jgi:NADP-dependent 3-hydroxy acid dehydrogenase YdfG
MRAEALSQPHGTAVIIGPGAHFGLEMVHQLQHIVSTIILVARTTDSLTPISSRVPKSADIKFVTADVTDQIGFAEALNKALSPSTQLRYVFYNLKQSSKGSALNLSAEKFTHMLEANLTGALTAIQYVAKSPYREPEVSIVISGGGFKDKPDESRLGLSVSKGGLHTLVLALAPLLRKRGIKIKTAVIDGVVRADGPLLPAYVAGTLIRLAESSTATVVKVNNRSQVQDRQLSLF